MTATGAILTMIATWAVTYSLCMVYAIVFAPRMYSWISLKPYDWPAVPSSAVRVSLYELWRHGFRLDPETGGYLYMAFPERFARQLALNSRYVPQERTAKGHDGEAVEIIRLWEPLKGARAFRFRRSPLGDGPNVIARTTARAD